jgi:hypothetical protein
VPPGVLSCEHDELMPQHEQLDISGELVAPAPDQQPQYGREGEVNEGKEHAPMLPCQTTRAARPRTWVLKPSVDQFAKTSAIWHSRARVNQTTTTTQRTSPYRAALRTEPEF